MGGPEREILLDAHDEAGEHPDQQTTTLRRIVSDGLKSRSGEPGSRAMAVFVT
jgi:hypothetical protein